MVDGKVLTLTYDQPFDPTNVPGREAFTVSSAWQPIIGVAVRGRKVELSLGFEALPCTAFTVSYVKPSANALRNVWGTQADGFSEQAVTNAQAAQCAPNWLRDATLGSVIVRARRPFAQDAEPRAEWFTVAATGGPVTVTEAAFSADDPHELKLELSRDIVADEAVTVSYQRPVREPGLWDIDGNQLADVVGWPVSNETPVAAASAETVAVVSAPGADATYAAGDAVRVKVTFGETVAVDTSGGTPRLRLDLDPADGGERWAAYEDGSGTNALTFAWEAASGDLSTAGVAVLADTLELNGGTIASAATQTAAALGHAGLAHDPAHGVDAVPPELLRGEIDGGTMTLWFSEALDPDSTGARSTWPWRSRRRAWWVSVPRAMWRSRARR